MTHEPIAVVGMGCRFPKAATPAELWALMMSGVDAITEVPRDRFDLDAVFDAAPATPGKIMSRWGGFLENVDRFDAGFFGISPREADRLDPQQRLLLEVAWHALEDAGYVAAAPIAAHTGVFVGMWLNEYESRLYRDPAAIDFYMTTGSGRYSASGRLSFCLGFEGPSVTVDTACSSSLVAVHLACQSLRSGESEMALAGGANVILEPSITIAYSQSRMMAPDGRCKFGDARGDGYVRSDGAGLVVLKRLSRAVADRDRIYAVIRGSAVNNDGRTSGFLATPGRAGQETMLRRAYHDAGVSPACVQYVEAHGTGTRAGDPVELGALGAVLGEGRAPDAVCRVGSIKTNIGHTESAAGVAGLIKVALSLNSGSIPPSLHFDTPNPDIPWADLPVRVQTDASPWPDMTTAPIAGVSAFGIAGTNAHVVLQQYRAGDPVDTSMGAGSAEGLARVLPISSHTEETLAALSTDYADFLEQDRGSLGDVCYTAAARRGHQPHRLAVVGRNHAQVAERIRETLHGWPVVAAGVAAGVADGEPRRVVFVFPGQGSQWLGMGRDLLATEPVFRDAIGRCDTAVRSLTGWSVIQELQAGSDASRLAEIDVVQPVLFSVQIALAALWQSWGVTPDAVAGHSMGEVAAAYVAGALTLEDAARVICRRSALMRRVSGQGAMAVVELSMADAAAAIAGFEDRLSVAVSNSRRSSVLSGDPAALDAVIERLEVREVFCRLINVDVASHSPQMDPLRQELRQGLEGMTPRNASVPFYSTVTGAVTDGSALDVAYWERNLRQAVLFSRTVERLLQDGYVTFVEMSPHPLLVGAVQELARDAGVDRAVAVGSLRRNENERETILGSVAQLYVRGQEIAWTRVSPGDGRVISVPGYCWQRERFWYDAGTDRPRTTAARERESRGPGRAVASAVHAGTFFWDFDLSLDAWPELRDHRVHGAAVLPAAAYVAFARTCAAQLLQTASLDLAAFTIDSPLALSESGPSHVQIVARVAADGSAAIEILSADANGDAAITGQGVSMTWRRHASCRAAVASDPSETPESFVAGEIAAPADVHYSRMAARGLTYGPAYRTVDEIRYDGPRAQGTLLRAGSVIGPELIDGALQMVLGLAPAACGVRSTYVPVAVSQVVFTAVTPAAGALVCDAMLNETATEDAQVFEGNLVVRDANGVALVVMRGVRFQRVGAERSIDECFYRMTWPAEALASKASSGSAAAGTWLIVPDRSSVGTQIAATLEARGGTSVIAAGGIGGAGVDTPVDFGELIRTASSRGDLRGIVYLPTRDIEMAGTSADEAVQSCLGPLALAQAAATAGLSLGGGIAFVTSGAQRVGGADGSLSLAQAPVWGFNSALRAEHPELHSACIDIDVQPDPADVTALVDELVAGLPADRVAFRNGSRRVARLEATPLSSAPTTRDELPRASSSDRPFRVSIPRPGVLEAFEARPLTRRAPAAHEVEIEVHATALNFMNVMSAMGMCPGYANGAGPLGIECAGRVSAVGADVHNWSIGDEVAAVAFDCLASHAVTDARLVVRRPVSLDAEQAAGLPIAFLTAWYALYHLARMSAGDRVLVHSAAGGVGLAALQLARRAGAEVIATAGTEAKRAWLRSLGIRHVFDSRSGQFAPEVLAATDGEGVDIVLNSLAGEAIGQGLSVLRPCGRFVEIGKRDIYENRQIGLLPFQRNLSYFAVDLDRMARERPAFVGSMLAEIMALVDRGDIQPLQSRSFPLEHVADAFREMAQGRHTGKLVISVREGRLPHAGNAADPVEAAIGGTVLITGGLGALGLTIAGWLAERGVTHLALLGRTAGAGVSPTPIQRLEARGVVVRQLGADVADAAQLAVALDVIRRDMPPLTGVIHAAGSLDDATVLQLRGEQFLDVMRPKVHGAWHLDRLTAADPLEFFVMMGSIASFFGLAGQANYASANAFLDALAEDRRQRGRPALTVSWGPWSGGGLAAGANRGSRLAARGLESLTPEDGVAALEQMMRSSETHVVAMRCDVDEWIASAGGASLPILDRVHDDDVPPSVREQSSPNATGIREAIEQAQPGHQRRAVLEGWLRDHVAHVLRMPPARVELTKAFRTMGLDSLMGLELRNRLESAAAIALPVTAIWNHPTVAQLAPQIAARMGVALEAAQAQTPGTASSAGSTAGGRAEGADDLDQLISELEHLSDEEARRLVAGDL